MATKKPKANRLFCARSPDGGVEFCVVAGLDAAMKQLGKTARYPMDEEVREFFAANSLQAKSVIEVGRMFGVSAQTVSNWRRRAGVPTATSVRTERRRKRAEAVYTETAPSDRTES